MNINLITLVFFICDHIKNTKRAARAHLCFTLPPVPGACPCRAPYIRLERSRRPYTRLAVRARPQGRPAPAMANPTNFIDAFLDLPEKQDFGRGKGAGFRISLVLWES